jgi:Sec-independent protein secretion pathway component TatC
MLLSSLNWVILLIPLLLLYLGSLVYAHVVARKQDLNQFMLILCSLDAFKPNV